jgi:hypothetical protein
MDWSMKGPEQAAFLVQQNQVAAGSKELVQKYQSACRRSRSEIKDNHPVFPEDTSSGQGATGQVSCQGRPAASAQRNLQGSGKGMGGIEEQKSPRPGDQKKMGFCFPLQGQIDPTGPGCQAGHILTHQRLPR